MAKREIRGLQAEDEIRATVPRRDTRLLEHKIRDALENPRHVAIGLILAYAAGHFFPLTLYLTLILGTIAALVAWNNETYLVLPMRLPKGTPIKKDRNALAPQGLKYLPPSGQYFIGVVKETLKQVWQSGKDMRTHWIILGTTGSGKTVTMVSLAANSLAMGSGVYYSDAKATPDLDWDIATLARLFGREDDLLVTNYITGTAKQKEVNPERSTNTDNPYSIGTADSLMQILSALMSESGGDNQVFQDRALAAMSAMLFALVELRDKDEILMGIDTIRDHLSLAKFIEMRHNAKLSEKSKSILLAYLSTALPGYRDDQPAEKQPEQVGVQHGYAQSYFSRAVSSLTDTYGRIFLTDMGEVDKIDAILNRRIVVTMLPALEKAGPELQNIGKMNFASVRDGLRVGLGKSLEGSRAEVLDNLPTSSEVPTMIIMDELAYQMVDGIAVTAAQARGLGICMIYGMQDFAGPQKANEHEFQQILGSTTNKFIMKLEDPQISWEQVQTIAGEGLSAEVQHLERRAGAGNGGYFDNPTAAYQQRARIDLMDLRQQVEGEGFLINGARIMRIDTFTITLDRMDDYRINRFLPVREPNDEDYPDVRLHNESLTNALLQIRGNEKLIRVAPSERMQAAWRAFDARGEDGQVLSAIAAVATYEQWAQAAEGGGKGTTLEQEPESSNQPQSADTNRASEMDDPLPQASASDIPNNEAATENKGPGKPVAAAVTGMSENEGQEKESTENATHEDTPAIDPTRDEALEQAINSLMPEPALANEDDEPADDEILIYPGEDEGQEEQQESDESTLATESNKAADTGTEEPYAFLDHLLDTGDMDFLFAYQPNQDMDYPVADALAVSETRLQQAYGTDNATIEDNSKKIQERMHRAIRYPNPPEPQATPETQSEIAAAISTLVEQTRRDNRAQEESTQSNGGSAKHISESTLNVHDDPSQDI